MWGGSTVPAASCIREGRTTVSWPFATDDTSLPCDNEIRSARNKLAKGQANLLMQAAMDSDHRCEVRVLFLCGDEGKIGDD